MKKIFFILLFSLYSVSQTPANDLHWQLLWEDNFNFFDQTKWLKVDWAKHGDDPQLILANNVWIANGNLVIKTDNSSNYCPANPPTIWGACEPCDNKWYHYASGWVETKSNYNIKYGYIEAEIKFPKGLWPSFWTFVGAGLPSFTNAAEIDIVEITGDMSPSVIGTNIHKKYCNCNVGTCITCDNGKLFVPQCPNYDNSILCYGLNVSLSGFSYTSWHTYAIEWSPDKIIWYIDGVQVRNLPNHGIIDPVRLILSVGVDPYHLPNNVSFPVYTYVNYVKVYKLRNDCKANMNVCGYNFSTHDNRVKKNITIGNGTCNNSLNVGDKVFLRASEGVLINGDFTVPVGSELYIDVNSCYY